VPSPIELPASPKALLRIGSAAARAMMSNVWLWGPMPHTFNASVAVGLRVAT
jgi:hypothetical protein